MNRYKLFLFLFMVFLISGCSTLVRPVKAMSEFDSDGNNITILRNYNIFSGNIRFWPTVDGQEISGLFPNEHISFALPPGKYSIGVSCGWLADKIEINVKEKDMRYFKISPSLLGSIRGAEIEEITESEAIERSKNSTRIKTGFMSDCNRKSVTFESNPDFTCASYIWP
jgi:hypothetical protein